MITRRSLLASASALTTVTLAGCSSALGDANGEHYIDVLNGADEPHRFAVTIRDGSGAVVFEREYDLPAGEGDENRTIDGDPAEIDVTVDERDRVSFPWAPREGSGSVDGECSQGTSTSLTVYYDRQVDEGVTTTYSCETVRGGQ